MSLLQWEKDEILRLKKQNYLNFTEDELDKNIYRIIPFESILEILTTQSLTLVKTKFWEDPYENHFIKCTFIDGNLNIPINALNLQEQVFGQCWTIYEESDAFWRIYSPTLKGVRLKTTIRKLFDVIFDNENRNSLNASFIGKVKYENLQDIRNDMLVPGFAKNVLHDFSGRKYLDTHLIKRKEFEHENEVRLLYNVESNSPDTNYDIKKFKINPNNLFESILLDPRVSDLNQKIITDTIQQLGYTNPIEKSDLYTFTPLNLII